ncbi:hypothetical protein [Clostridium beijerinckii]|uniref:hypothetical protein n=1 Tax=Clostridium beijerinckii TaxID=1520 RepID=UPI001570F65E|nr:hypothetical protein [Clostridium beijerinckii]NRU52417.1 hypothetical protein [Clostridium beijerinckii]NYC69138.1 hypothetical protein [Clostridium beijerinckii]NYC91908.1 hypothetical protein [Clostridium beijerinckii]
MSEFYNRLKAYINQEKDKSITGDVEEWIYEKLLIKMDEIKTELDNESPIESIRKIANKYMPTIEDEERAEKRLSESTNYKINEYGKMTKEEFDKWLDENIEERVELETNTYFDEEKFVKDFGKE